MMKDPMMGLLMKLKQLQFDRAINNELSEPITPAMLNENIQALKMANAWDLSRVRSLMILAVIEEDNPADSGVEHKVKLQQTLIGEEAIVEYMMFDALNKLQAVAADPACEYPDGTRRQKSAEHRNSVFTDAKKTGEQIHKDTEAFFSSLEKIFGRGAH